jgi:transposase
MASQLTWLSDAEWARIEPLLPHGRRGAHRVDDRRVIRPLVAPRGAQAVAEPPSHDRDAYRARNLVERLWCRLKDWRRIATRYDKTR